MEKANFGKIKLGRLFVGVIICVLMITTSMATETTISVKMNKQVNPSINSLSYTFLFKEPSFSSIQAAGSDYTTIDMQGCLAIGKQAGDPVIPIRAITLLLPPKKAVASINVVGTPIPINPSGINLNEKPILPYQRPVPIGNNEQQEFIKNANIYSSSRHRPPRHAAVPHWLFF